MVGMRDAPLLGRRILVVENEPLIAAHYESILMDAGAEVVGPAATVEEATRLAEADRVSAALLDIRLTDGEVWPVASLLMRQSVPFAFCTGYFDMAGISAWPGNPILFKPAQPQLLIRTIADLCTEQEA